MSKIGAYMFIGKTEKARLDEIRRHFNLDTKQNRINTRIIEIPTDKKSIGIADIREAIKYIAKAPSQNERKHLIIPQAESMTVEAQNALLKTLEEPPSYAIIVLGVSSEGSVLGTVASRCKKHTIKHIEEPSNPELLSFSKVSSQTYGERFMSAEELAKQEKETILSTIDSWVSEIRESYMTGDVTTAASDNIKIILDIREDLQKTAVNTRLALEHLLLSLK